MDKSEDKEIKIIPLSVLLHNKALSLILNNDLQSFKCDKNSDEEFFLHENAVKFEQRNKSRTYLVYNRDFSFLLGYFTVAFKSIDLKDVSKTKIKQITAGENVDTYSAYLIGHLAKNSAYSTYLNGKILLDEALNIIVRAQDFIGGRLVYLDCKDESKLKSFYTENDFTYFNTSKQTGLMQYYKKI